MGRVSRGPKTTVRFGNSVGGFAGLSIDLYSGLRFIIVKPDLAAPTKGKGTGQSRGDPRRRLRRGLSQCSPPATSVTTHVNGADREAHWSLRARGFCRVLVT